MRKGRARKSSGSNSSASSGSSASNDSIKDAKTVVTKKNCAKPEVAPKTAQKLQSCGLASAQKVVGKFAALKKRALVSV